VGSLLRVWGMGFRVEGFLAPRCSLRGMPQGVSGEFRAQGLRFRLRVEDSEFRVSGFLVLRCSLLGIRGYGCGV
jgi:hypothetical protein